MATGTDRELLTHCGWRSTADGLPHLRRHRRHLHGRGRRRRSGDAPPGEGADRPRACVPEHRRRARAACAGARGHGRRAARTHRRVHLRHDPGDERDRRGPHGPDRVLHHRGLPGHPPAPRGREARAFPAAPLPAPVRAPLPDVRDPRAHRLRGGRLRRARRGERPHRDRERAAPGRGGSRGVPDLGDRQPGPRAPRRRAARPRVAGGAVHALAPAESDHPRVPAGVVDRHRRVAEAADAGIPADAGAGLAACRTRRSHLRRHLVRRRLASGGGDRAADLLDRLRSVHGARRGADVLEGGNV